MQQMIAYYQSFCAALAVEKELKNKTTVILQTNSYFTSLSTIAIAHEWI